MGLAVVIPVHDDQDSIGDALGSALDQAEVDEVIVVDDGSTDGTALVVSGTDDPRVRLVRQANLGPSAARNSGAEVASSDHLVFLDGDDVLLPGSARELLSRHLGGADLVRSGAIRRLEGQPDHESLAEPSNWTFPRGTPLAGSFSLTRRLFGQIGGYDTELRYGENTELLYRAQRALARANGEIAFTRTPTVLVRVDPARPPGHYRTRRIAAVERMLDIHGAELKADRSTFHDHHAIASHLYREEGRRGEAVRHAIAAVRVRPASPRAWGRVALGVLPARRDQR